MTVKVNNNVPASRVLVTGEVLPAQSTIGVMVYEDGKTTYDAKTYVNVPYYTTNGSTWEVTEQGYTAPKLSATPGKTIAYYPWEESVTDFKQIPVSTGNTDYMYSNVAEVSFANHEATYNMTHALAGIRLTVKKNSAHPEMSVTKVTAQSDGFATSATLDATTGILSSVTGSNETLTFDEEFTTTTDGKVIGFVAVPAESASSVTFMVETSGDTYTATASMTEAFKQGYIYDYTLTFNAAGLTISSVAVNTWNNGGSDDLDLQKLNPWTILANGVYAVSADGMPVEVANATAECIAVALITDNQRIMIEKTQSYDATNTTFYWGKNFYGKNVAGITETTDQAVAKADFSGKEHTAAIITAYTEHSVDMDARDMCKVLQTFNDGKNNGGFTDWYIPAAGQLYEIYTNMTNINAALTAMSSTAFSDNIYWSSSEYSSNYGWVVSFNDGGVYNDSENGYDRVRFVRDI